MSAASENPSFEIARQAIDAIRSNSVEVTPPSFELWFTHLSGANADLSGAVEKTIADKGALDGPTIDALYDRFIGGDESSEQIASLASAICAQVSQINDSMGGATENYRAYSRSLADALGQFDGASEPADVKALVHALADATRAMASKNAELQQKLSDADEELSTMRENISRIQSEALTDALTGVANRKHFDRFMAETLEASATGDAPNCLAIGDVDHFKSFNDTWGHQVGDMVLKLVAGVLSANVKGRDLVARYGGEEFALILPDTSLSDSIGLVDRLRTEIAKRRLTKRNTNETIGHVTISFGVAQLRPGEDAASAIERADRALYRAKETGRNKVVGEGDVED
ncbi:MAG: GGDEF domain-containing protein [Pseudomonadota bacterium]